MSASRSSRRSLINPVIENLEIRRMLSADLTGAFAGIVPSAIHSGNGNHLAIRVVNEGDASARGKVTVDLFASPESSDDSDVLLDAVTRNMNLKPGRGVNVNFHFADQSTLADGQYSLIASIDSSKISNVDPAGNTFAAVNPISVQQPAADLTSESINSPDQPIVIAGTNIGPQPASVLVENRGSIAAKGDISVNFYLSTDQTLDSHDALAASVSDVAVNLKAGKGKVFGEELIPPVGTPAGEYYLFAVATPGPGIVQRSIVDETGIATEQVQVVRPIQTIVPTQPTPVPTKPSLPQPVSGVTGGTGTTTTTTPAPGNGTVDSPPSDSSPTSTDCPPATDCPTSTDDSGDGQQSDDGSGDGQQPDQGPDDSSGDNSQQDNSGQDNSGSDNSNPPTDNSGDQGDTGQDNSGDQGDSGQDGSDQSTDDSGDQGDGGQDDSGDQSDSDQDGSDQSTDDSGDQGDGGQDDSGDQGDTGSGDDDSGGDDGGDDGSTDAWHPASHSKINPTHTQTDATFTRSATIAAQRSRGHKA